MASGGGVGTDAATGTTEHLKTICPHCKRRVEYPPDSYGNVSPCPNCSQQMGLVPGPCFPTRDYEIIERDSLRGPFSFGQVVEQWKSGRINLNSKYRVAPDADWRSVRELGLETLGTDSSNVDWLTVANEIPFYIKSPQVLYPEGPYTFLELKREAEAGRIPASCLFWFPTMGYWLDFELIRVLIRLEIHPKPAFANKFEKMLESILRNWEQRVPPPFHVKKTWRGVNTLIWMKIVGLFALAVIGLVLVMLLWQRFPP
jgi:hypothetical protein